MEEHDGLVIIPAKSEQELIVEGKVLGHCVGRKFITAPILLAPVGHTDTHFMQDMHLAVSLSMPLQRISLTRRVPPVGLNMI